MTLLGWVGAPASRLARSYRFEELDFGAFLARGRDGRRAAGTLPIRGSAARISSQARRAASSKSGALAGRTCQPVTFLPSRRMERMLGKSRRRVG